MWKLCVAVAVLVTLAAASWHDAPDAVPSLPGIGAFPQPVYAGYVAADENASDVLFYLFFASQDGNASAPTIQWLQGGPGCSSLFGTFVENGPWVMQDNGTLASNPFSWNKHAHMLFWDQPAGTRYSYSNDPATRPRNEEEVAAQLFYAIRGFFQRHPEYLDNQFWLSGESYAGKYIPGLAYYWLQMAQHNQSKGMPALRGAMIGDGWVVPSVQCPAYAEFSFLEGLVNASTYQSLLHLIDNYHHLVAEGRWIRAYNLDNRILNIAAAGRDVYDLRYASGHDPTNKPTKWLYKYLTNATVMHALHANHSWADCSSRAGVPLNYDEEKNINWTLPYTLRHIPVLLYNGNKDITCNFLGTQQWSDQLTWDGQTEFLAAANIDWTVDGSPAGYFKSSSTLTRLVIDNAGHMVPYSQPRPAQRMVEQFVFEGGFPSTN